VSEPLSDVADLIRRETGIFIKAPQLPALEAALSRLEPPLSAAAFLAARVNTPHGEQLFSRLIDEVTVKETFFMRQPKELGAIDWEALLTSARAQGRECVRVWVAGCATGEEAYTLAILASEALRSETPPVSILATDISESALASARRARYGQRRTRGLDSDLRERYLLADGERLVVGARLRRLVEFKRHNLARDDIPPFGLQAFELIVCRNVLIYFDGDVIERVIAALESALSPAGMLLLGAADRLCDSSRRLSRLEAMPPPGLEAMPAPRPAGMPTRHGRRHSSARTLRRPLRREELAPAAADTPPPLTRVVLEDALGAADRGELEATIGLTAQVLEQDPLNADAHFIHGLAKLGLGDAEAAAGSLRRALYVDPAFGLAAFQLGRAHEARGDRAAATRAYSLALGALGSDGDQHREIAKHLDVADMTKACEMRLRALAPGAPGPRRTAPAAGAARSAGGPR
jgi:chemotaxis protein methyltransferase CheR